VISAENGAEIAQATQGDKDRSQVLTAYPQDRRSARHRICGRRWSGRPACHRWLRQRAGAGDRSDSAAAAVKAKTEAGETAAAANCVDSTTAECAGTVVRGDYLSELLHNRDLSLGMMLAGIAVAFGLGAAHALSPGHGKTIVAAYLVGSRGTARHAIFLGGMVTFTPYHQRIHAGFVTLFLSRYVAPEKISPVLEVIAACRLSGLARCCFISASRAEWTW